MTNLDGVKVELNLGLVKMEGRWIPTDEDQQAAWEMYVELVTRISVIEVKSGEGLLREALSSLHSLFEQTRRILRVYGPSVARLKPEGELSFGFIAIVIVNYVLRPFLTKWHPLLLDYEEQLMDGVSRVEHEKHWEKNQDLRQHLAQVRTLLIEYANLLAQAAGVPSLVFEDYSLHSIDIVKQQSTLRGSTLAVFRNE
jgi:hypothetical protein